ncbi:MAG: ROK family protein, partial [Bacilli bacterium]
AKNGDKLALVVVDEAIFYLAKACETISMIYDVNKFVIGGGVSKAGSFLINKLKKEYYHQALVEFRDVMFESAKYGNDAGIIGAAILGKNK